MKSSVRNFIVLLILCSILLIVPFLYRSEYVGKSLIGDQSYYFLRLAETKCLDYDNFSFGGQFLVMELGWPILLSISPLFLSWFLPIAFGLFSFVLFYLIAGKFNNENLRGVSTLLFIISPLFIYFFTISNNSAPAIFLTLLGLYLLLEKKYSLSMIVLGIIPFFNVSLFVINILLLLSYIILKERSLLRYFSLTFIIGISLIILQFWRVYWFGLHFYLNYNLSVITDFGANYGIGFFIIILGVLGIYFKRQYFVYALLILGFVLSGYFKILLIYINFILVIYTAIALIVLWKLKWSSILLKNITFLVLICCLMFTTISFVNEYVNYSPDIGTLDGLEFFKNKPNVVFSDISRGDWITYFGAKSFMDNNYYFVPNYDERNHDYDSILFSKNYEEFVNLIKKYNIKYFFVDRYMRERIYGGETEGMLFWLKYGNDFNLAYSNNELHIYEFNEKK